MCEHGRGRKTRYNYRWKALNMGRRGCTSKARMEVLCVGGCYILRYAIYLGFGLFFFSSQEKRKKRRGGGFVGRHKFRLKVLHSENKLQYIVLYTGVIRAGEPCKGGNHKRKTTSGQLENKYLRGWRSSEGEVTLQRDGKRCRLEAG